MDKKYDTIRTDRSKDVYEFRMRRDSMEVRDALDMYLSLIAKVESVDEQLVEERNHMSAKINSLKNNGDAPSARTYVLACTNSECKGMLSNENKNENGQYICSICHSITCAECKMPATGTDHSCDPDVLKTLEFMATSSKPCPGCSAPIYRISGCNAMFCVSCHATFDWRTLKLTTGSIHNPHHAEWLRRNRNRPREIGDIPCGRELSIDIGVEMTYKLEALAREIQEKKDRRFAMEESNYMFELIRVGIHHTQVTLPALGRDRYGHNTNQTLRVLLLTNRMDEATFKREIQRRDKANSRRQELLQIVMTYRDSLTDIIWPFTTRERKPVTDWLNMVQELRALEIYINDCFQKVSSVYGSVQHEIGSDRNIR